MNFFDLTQVTPKGVSADGRTDFEIQVPEGWQQGAGAFGGWVLAVLVRSVEACVPERVLRSLTAEIPAPVKVGTAKISVEVLRAGQSVTVVAARLVQGEGLAAHAVAVLGASRSLAESLDHVAVSPPVIADWRGLAPVPHDVPNLPAFARHFEFRLVDGIPFQKSSRGIATGWIRARDPGPVKDAALVVAHVDAWWPAEFARMRAPRPTVTAAFTLQMVGGANVWKSEAPLLHTSRTVAVRDGYVTEFRELWTEAHELVALNEQTMVIVK